MAVDAQGQPSGAAGALAAGDVVLVSQVLVTHLADLLVEFWNCCTW
jgi:hypothetical protein